MKEYLNLFIDLEYPKFIDKYLNTKTLKRLKHIGQFCGCDYSKLYSPLFFYSRFDHSLVVAHMTWHFTKNKEETIAALLHDVGTPCFAHTIDFVLNDTMNQESSEKNITDLIKQDSELCSMLEEDNIPVENLNQLEKYPILENKSPRLCTDRLDGVLHSCYIWLHTHSLNQIKEVYDNIVILENEDGKKELGFMDQKVCETFTQMVKVYAKTLQSCENKYIQKYICEIIKKAINQNLFTLEDLYIKKESEIIHILKENFPSFTLFNESQSLIKTNIKPNQFYISLDTKKRNVIPLLKINDTSKRIIDVSKKLKNFYLELSNYQDSKYAYIEQIKEI